MKFQKAHSTLATNLAAFGASEVASKVSRLLVVVVVARTLDLTTIGLAAAAMAVSDILKSLTENGVGQRIIAAKQSELQATCATASRVFWAWCIGLFALQAAVAAGLYLIADAPMLALLVLIMGAEYLFMPAGLVQVALAMRAGKMKETAAIAGAQVVGANVMAVLWLVIWPSAFALLIPRLLSAPIWLIAVRRLHPWTRDEAAGFAPLRPFFTFGRAVLGIELVKALRLQADKILVGAMLGGEALGLYFMAFNAGLSLSNALSTALSTVLFAHLARSEDQTAALRSSFLVAIGAVGPVVILQALAAPIYVPILLGEAYANLSPVVAILCLVAIPMTLWATSAAWLRATNRAEAELRITVAIAAGAIANTVVLAPFGLLPVAIGYTATLSVILFAAALPALKTAFDLPLQRV